MPAPRCPTCGADRPPDYGQCWLCGEAQPVLAELVPESQSAREKLPEWLVQTSLWLAVAVVVLVLIGLVRVHHPYYALAFAIAALPALAISFGGAAIGILLGKPWHPTVKFAVAMSIAALLLPIAVIIALCIACFAEFAAHPPTYN